MNTNDFELVSRLVKERSGLMLSEDKAYLLESRLNPVARRHGFKGMDELVQAIRGYEAEDWEAKEITRYHVHGLRSKLGGAEYVQTVRGVGYRLVVPVE